MAANVTTTVNCPFNQPFSVSLSGTGSSGTLTADIIGGTGPYTYNFYCVASGPCTNYNIDVPSGKNSNGTPTSTYQTTVYANAIYNFYCNVIDSNNVTIESNAYTAPLCLVPETLITLLDNSQIELSKIEIGDVLFNNNKVIFKTIHNTNKVININKGLLITSEGHINIVKEKDLVSSINLKLGDYLIDINNNSILVESIEIEEGNFTVINISTENKTFIANNVLTHNKLTC